MAKAGIAKKHLVSACIFKQPISCWLTSGKVCAIWCGTRHYAATPVGCSSAKQTAYLLFASGSHCGGTKAAEKRMLYLWLLVLSKSESSVR